MGLTVFAHLRFMFKLKSQVVNWGKKYLVNFNSTKTKLPQFSYHREYYFQPSVWLMLTFRRTTHCAILASRFLLTGIGEIIFNELLRLLLRKFVHCEVTDNPSYRLFKSTICPCIIYCCHICSGAFAIHLKKIQRWVCNVIGPGLSSRFQPLYNPHYMSSLCLFKIIISCQLF